jgi:hypothetical protein
MLKRVVLSMRESRNAEETQRKGAVLSRNMGGLRDIGSTGREKVFWTERNSGTEKNISSPSIFCKEDQASIEN